MARGCIFCALIPAYSNQNSKSYVQPNYYVALYYTARYLTRSLPADSQVLIFTSSAEEQAQFDTAYRFFAAGQDYKEAQRLMEPLAQNGHLEALQHYSEILYYQIGKYQDDIAKKARSMGDPVQNDDLTGVLAMCFEKNSRALKELAWMLSPDHDFNIPGVRKNEGLFKIICDWRIAVCANKISQNPKDGYAMMELAQMYKDAPYKNEGYTHYWETEAHKIEYGAVIFETAQQLYFDVGLSGLLDFDSIDEAYELAKKATKKGIEQGKDLQSKILAQRNKMQRHAREASAISESIARRQAESSVQMADYRKKLDSQETWLNYLTEGTPWTDRDSQLYGWMTQDYDRYMEASLRTGMREMRERDQISKLIKEDSDNALLDRMKQDAQKNKSRSGTAKIPPVKGKGIQEHSSLNTPPIEPEMIKDEHFIALYRECNELRQVGDFREAEKAAEELLALYPDSHMAHWMHFLAVYGIVFQNCYEVYHINRMIRQSFYYNEDYEWLVNHVHGNDLETYKLYFLVFEKSRRDYLEAGKQTEETDVVFCYRRTDDDGKETAAAGFAQLLMKESRENVKLYSSADFPFEQEEIYREAFTYTALKNAKIMVLIADNTADLLDVEIQNQWTRYKEWKDAGARKTIFAVGPDSLTQYYKDFANQTILLDDSRVSELYCEILKECLRNRRDSANEDLLSWMDGHRKLTTPQLAEAAASGQIDGTAQISLKTSSDHLLRATTNPMYKQDDFWGPNDGSAIIDMNTATFVSCAVHLRKPVEQSKTVRLNVQILTLEDQRIASLYWDINADAGNDRFAAGWGFQDANGNFVVEPGIYRLRIWIDDSEPVECLFGLVKNNKVREQALYDHIISDCNLVPTREEYQLSPGKRKEALRERARCRYLHMLDLCQSRYHQEDSITEYETVVKGFFKKKKSIREKNFHKALIRLNGTVEVVSWQRQAPYDKEPYPFRDAHAAAEIEQLRDIVQIACISSGLVAMNTAGELFYAGRVNAFKNHLSQIGRAREIAHSHDSVFVLTWDGKVVEVSEQGITTRVEKDAKSIYIEEAYNMGYGDRLFRLGYLTTDGHATDDNLGGDMGHLTFSISAAGELEKVDWYDFFLKGNKTYVDGYIMKPTEEDRLYGLVYIEIKYHGGWPVVYAHNYNEDIVTVKILKKEKTKK